MALLDRIAFGSVSRSVRTPGSCSASRDSASSSTRSARADRPSRRSRDRPRRASWAPDRCTHAARRSHVALSSPPASPRSAAAFSSASPSSRARSARRTCSRLCSRWPTSSSRVASSVSPRTCGSCAWPRSRSSARTPTSTRSSPSRSAGCSSRRSHDPDARRGRAMLVSVAMIVRSSVRGPRARAVGCSDRAPIAAPAATEPTA